MPSKSKATDLWGDFAAELRKRPERLPPGKGWMTFVEMKTRFKVAAGILRVAISKGGVERFKGYTIRNGRVSNQMWYRPKS